jgi:hypothetical protein
MKADYIRLLPVFLDIAAHLRSFCIDVKQALTPFILGLGIRRIGEILESNLTQTL